MPRTISTISAALALALAAPARSSGVPPNREFAPPTLPPPVVATNGLAAQSLAETIPPRQPGAPTGSEFGQVELASGDHDRYAAAETAVLDGNVPAFLRRLVPVRLERPADAPAGPAEAIVWVTPDYLAVGDDADFLRVPLDLPAAGAVATALGFSLPTTRIVDAIYEQAEVHLAPIPLPPGPRMRSMPYLLEHQAKIEAEFDDTAHGRLIAGHKKDVVLSARLRSQPDRVAIYGWHRPDGRPIQPLSTVHGLHYADYSHGIRLVSRQVTVDGSACDLFDALADPAVAPLLSREGLLPDAASLLNPDSAG